MTMEQTPADKDYSAKDVQGWVEVFADEGLTVDLDSFVSKLEAYMENEPEDSAWSKKMAKLSEQVSQLIENRRKASKEMLELLRAKELI